MYRSRKIQSDISWRDSDGVKIYTISTDQGEVLKPIFNQQLKQVKASLSLNWPQTASFAIFHEGESMKYLVLAWWGNDNELFTSVSVYLDQQWIIDASRYSFCLYDMEVMWKERHFYIETMDCSTPSLTHYQSMR